MRIPTLLTALALTLPVAAQHVSGTFLPQPTGPGIPITFTATNVTGATINLPSPCTWYRIHQGTQTGTVVGPNGFCITLIIPVPAGGTATFSWDQKDGFGNQVPNGRYWVETRTWDANFSNLVVDWFCVSIQDKSDPALTQSGLPIKGQTLPLNISSPNDPGAVYFVGLSLSENNPVSLLGMDLCLSLPIEATYVNNAIGVLDPQGLTSAPAVPIPNLAFLVGVGFHSQAALFSGGWFKATNALSFTILP